MQFLRDEDEFLFWVNPGAIYRNYFVLLRYKFDKKKKEFNVSQ
jgi:hypothetical protein